MTFLILVLSAVTLLLASQATAGSSLNEISCRKLFAAEAVSEPLKLDLRYGRVSQVDPYLVAKRLAKSEKFSLLCGPACLYNVMEKFRVVRGDKETPGSDPAELARIVRKVFPAVGVPWKQIASQGTTPAVLGQALAKILSDEKTGLDVAHIDPYTNRGTQPRADISLDDLKLSVLPDHAVIILVAPHMADTLEEVRPRNLLPGHYLTVVGYDPNFQNRFYAIDSNNPDKIIPVYLTAYKPFGYSGQTFRVEFDHPTPYEVFMIIGLLMVQPHEDDENLRL